MNEKDFRKKLNNTLWLIADKVGMSPDDVRDFAITVYPDLQGKKKVISSLDAARLEQVVIELRDRTGIDVTIPKRVAKNKKKEEWQPGDAVDVFASTKQLGLIEELANSIPISDELLIKERSKMMKGKPGPLTKVAAQKLTEALKKLKKNGFKEKRIEAKDKENIVVH